MARRRVGVLFGGRSGEHEVSLASAYAVMQALGTAGYEVVPIGLDKHGGWCAGPEAWPTLRREARLAIGPGDNESPAAGHLAPLRAEAEAALTHPGNGTVTAPGDWLRQLDVVFPVLHGTYGEDGTIQGLLELLNLPYVGAGVAGSAVGMDKILAKQVLAAAGIAQVDFRAALRAEWERTPELVRERVAELGYPCFVKPANLGSSVGISKVHHPAELDAAMDEAARFDRRIIIEQGLEDVREIEVSVLGNDEPMVSVPGEIVSCHEFYDYEAKYLAGSSEERIPAPLPQPVIHRIQDLAVQAFRALDLAGMARVDFLVTRADHEVYLNEANTIPGFTPISMYPKLWAASGLPFEELVRKLIDLAVERHADRARSATSI